VQLINMYGAARRDQVSGDLADMLRQGFSALKGPVAATG